MTKAICITGLLILSACNQNKKQSESVDQKSADTTVTTEKEDMTPDAGLGESLAKMAPLTEQEMRDLLPLQLSGAARASEEVDGSIGTLSAMGEYRLNDSTELKLTIIDCAGPAGVGVYNMQYLGMLGIHEENEDEYTRTVDYGNGKAFESCSKKKTDCSLTWFVGRYLVSLEGNLTVGELKKLAGGINL
jgi:hypothetical protein